MNIMRKRLLDSLKNIYNNVFETFGYLTKYNREKLNIPKSHSSDAFVISYNFNAERIDVEYKYKKVRRHNRQLHKSKPSKGGKRRRNQSNYIINGFRRFDKVLYNGIECFITGKRTSGYFQLKTFDGTVVSQGVSSKRLRLLEPIKGWMINMEAAISPRPMEVVVSLPKKTMKINRYQGWIHSGHGVINDHQKNECIIEFKHVPKDKKDKLLSTCLNILNEEEEDFSFEYTEDFERIDANTLRVEDKHTVIDCDGKKIRIVLNPPNIEPYTVEYYITGIRFDKRI